MITEEELYKYIFYHFRVLGGGISGEIRILKDDWNKHRNHVDSLSLDVVIKEDEDNYIVSFNVEMDH